MKPFLYQINSDLVLQNKGYLYDCYIHYQLNSKTKTFQLKNRANSYEKRNHNARVKLQFLEHLAAHCIVKATERNFHALPCQIREWCINSEEINELVLGSPNAKSINCGPSPGHPVLESHL